MDRHRTVNTSKEDIRARATIKNKENPLSDTVYLIQNENEVLRMKNSEINLKLKELKMQLALHSQNIVVKESQIQHLRSNIKSTSFKQDIQIENEKKLLLEKLALLKSNEDILLRKVAEAREATIFQEQKISNIQLDRKGIQVQILSLKAQNQGTKIILRNLEEENQKLRQQNQILISKRQIYEPKQKQISIEIEERIRFIKNQQQNLKNLRRYETAKLLNNILTILNLKKLKEHFMKIQRYGLLKKFAKKKVFQLSMIKKKYLLFIKHRIMKQFRQSFNPLAEQQTAKRILAETHKRRVKAIIWRKWRKSTKQAEFTTIRRFQFQNVMEKLTESFKKTNLFASYNVIKYYKNNPIRERAALTIQNTFSRFMNRTKNFFMSSLRGAQKNYQLNLQIDASSREHSQMLIISLYFSAWGKLTKSSKIENMSIKRRYFKQLKKLLMLKKRRILGQMLMGANQKINAVDTASKIFTQLKKSAMTTRIEDLIEQQQTITQKSNALQDELNEMRTDKKQLYQELALLKVAKYLKTKMQKAFDIWRLRRKQSKVFLTITNLIQSKKSFDVNFAFSKILKKRFAMLKKSIRDKIQGCEFSYNYLLDQNKHIKQILDKKQHQLEKTKFVNILKRLVRNQKQIKLKFFYKFMKNGFKFWKFRKTCQRINFMIQTKVKIVFMWLLKKDKHQFAQQSRIDSFIEEKQKNIEQRFFKRAFCGFKTVVERNRRIKRVMGGIFERNLQLDFFTAFGKIRNEEHLYNRGLIQADINQIQNEINHRNNVSESEEKLINTLTERLKTKQQIFQQRKILGLYRFFAKSVHNKVGSFIKRWHNRVQRQNKVMAFAEALERKTRIMLKNKFLLTISRKNQDYSLNQLQEKLKKYQDQYQHINYSQQKYLKDMEEQSLKMKNQNQNNKKQGQLFQKKTDLMTQIKLKTFQRNWGKKLLAFIFKQWRVQTDLFVQHWTAVQKSITKREKGQAFSHFSKIMKLQVQNYKLRRNLGRIYHNAWRWNAGLGFKIWRLVNLNKVNQHWTQQHQKQMHKFDGLESIRKMAERKHNSQIDYRINDVKVRRVWTVLRRYCAKKVRINYIKTIVDNQIEKGYAGQFLSLVRQRVAKKIQLKANTAAFIQKWQKIKMKMLYQYTLAQKDKKDSFQRLFLHKCIPFLVHKMHEEFFTQIKNYNNNNEVKSKDKKTKQIQQVIETFEKKRKNILNTYLRRWRRNQYQMRIAKNLMKRITKNAMNWRVRDLFFSWKLQSEAKKVKTMHEQEGEVKKRKIEINRIKIFLQQFKKQKGLLLEDDGGQLVVSPRFQQKKDQQIKKDNNFRYRFISRLILSMNGYAAPVKVWNNMKMYMLVRQKYKKFAKIMINNSKKPELFYAFRIWNKAAKDFNKMFEIMERKDLIRILNRQKDKMEMEYSKKITLEQKIQQQMKAHKLLAYQEDRKQKLCAYVFLKNMKKVQTYALFAWKNKIEEMKQAESAELQDQGNTKINSLEEQVNELEESQRELRQNNQKLQAAVRQALQIAEMVKRITEQRDILSKLIQQKLMTCQSLQQENEQLNGKLYLAQKQAMNLLILSGERL